MVPTDIRARLTAIQRRSRLKTALRVGGLVTIVVGLMFLPDRSHGFTRRDSSAFSSVVDLGEFVPWGGACMAAGAVLFGASYLVRAGLTE